MVANADRKPRIVGTIERFEIAERWPTRFFTGHFVAFLARKAYFVTAGPVRYNSDQ